MEDQGPSQAVDAIPRLGVMAHGGGGTSRPPMNATDSLQDAVGQLRDTVESLFGTVTRAHDKLYGDYSAGPETKGEIQPESPGRIAEIERQVRMVTAIARSAVNVAESLDGKC